MKIAIVMGFFLPMPPDAGGATEKSWHRLSLEFARLGHEVTVYSRHWRGWPDEEVRDGVRHVRLRGFDHTGRLWRNLALDLLWGLRVYRRLGRADVTVVNSVLLPVWLGPLRRGCGRLVLMPGRRTKGQFRFYRRVDAVLAVSAMMRDCILRENPALGPRIDIVGYPIDWSSLSAAPRPVRPPGDAAPITLGFVGRIHREKGLELLVKACGLLRAEKDLPPWRIVLCGPRGVAEGGSGETFAIGIERSLKRLLPHDAVRMLPPMFQPARLAKLYAEIDLFCYPSLAAQGETFGVAVAEAMAAGAVPVVSDLSCFRDFVHAGDNGMVFQQDAPDAPARLATCLSGLLRDQGRRTAMAERARASVQRFDFPRYAEHLLGHFSALAATRPSSHE